MARAVHRLGTTRSLVVHGEDGLDEITLAGTTVIYDVTPKHLVVLKVTPEDFGLDRADTALMQGGNSNENAAIAYKILEGESGPKRDIVLANASAALVAAGFAGDFRQGTDVARRSIDSGSAMAKLRGLVDFTRGIVATA